MQGSAHLQVLILPLRNVGCTALGGEPCRRLTSSCVVYPFKSRHLWFLNPNARKLRVLQRTVSAPETGAVSGLQEERDEFKFKRYVIVTRAYTDAPPEGDKTGDGGSGDAEAEPSSSGHPASKKAKRKKVRSGIVQHHSLHLRMYHRAVATCRRRA